MLGAPPLNPLPPAAGGFAPQTPVQVKRLKNMFTMLTMQLLVDEMIAIF